MEQRLAQAGVDLESDEGSYMMELVDLFEEERAAWAAARQGATDGS